PEPRPGAVRALAGDPDVGAERALAAALDHPVGRLHEHGEVGRQPVGVLARHPGEAVARGLDLLAVVEDVRDVAHRVGHRGGELSATATPAFMSEVPHPYSRPPSTRLGRLPATGTVSRWPAITTRSPRPRFVRATTVLPDLSTFRCGCPARACSTSPASTSSPPLTDSMSTTAAVSVRTSCARSSIRRSPRTPPSR